MSKSSHDINKNHERGVVSILSVIFFIILMSILTVSFLRIVTDEQNQVIDDDLSKGALASAQSGVENAKRALLYCRQIPTAADCANLSNQTCPGIFASSSFHVVLGLRQSSEADGSIQVGDPSSNNNQRYTCVTVATDTPDYRGIINEDIGGSEDSMIIVPFKSEDTFNRVRFSWRQADPEDPSPPLPTTSGAGSVPLNTQPRRQHWDTNGMGAGGTGYLAVPRLQFIGFDINQPLADLADNSSAVFLFPYTPGTGDSGNIDMTSADPGQSFSPEKLPSRHYNKNCAGAEDDYLCTATFEVNSLAPNTGREYYLALRSVYAAAAFKVELLNNDTVVGFDNVQPEVDSTGAVGNVYKRVITRVAYEQNAFVPPNVIEGGSGVCKDFYVTRLTFGTDIGGTECLTRP